MTPARKNTRRIAAVHDLSGVGRVSLMVVIPILSTMGFDVCPLPTAILSNHTQYPEYSFLDLTDEMPKMIAGWKKLEIEFDAIYTGYLGSPRQIQIVSVSLMISEARTRLLLSTRFWATTAGYMPE